MKRPRLESTWAGRNGDSRLSFQRPSTVLGCSAFLATGRLRRMRGRAAGRSGLRKGRRFVATFSGTSPAAPTAARGCDLCLCSGEGVKRKRRPKTCLGRFRPRGVFRPQARSGRAEKGQPVRGQRGLRLSAPLVTPAPERIKAGAAFARGAVLPRVIGINLC